MIQYASDVKKSNEWLAAHTLTKKQLAQLIREKIERAKLYQLS